MRSYRGVSHPNSNACKFTPAGGKLTVTTKLVIPGQPSKTEQDEDDDFDRPARSQEFLSPQGPHDGGPSQNGDGNGAMPEDMPRLSATHLTQHNVLHSKPAPPLEWIVVRIEVSDTGCGIRPKDMVQSKLFCQCYRVSPECEASADVSFAAAFNQTEQGRLQGGKGTGLGLALVRQIVKLSGGRLGVQSKVGEGSTFWVELRTYIFMRNGDSNLSSHHTALGVGNKAIPALTSPMDLEEDEYSSPRQAVYSNTKDVAFKDIARDGETNVRSSSQFNQSHSSAALHSIMEQGTSIPLGCSHCAY